MNIHRPKTDNSFASLLNGYVNGAFTLAIVGLAAVLTFSQFMTFA